MMEAKRTPADTLANAVRTKFLPHMKTWGMSRLVIEARGWNRTVTDQVYSTTPTTIVTTRSGSSTVSTVTGGNVVSRNRYSHKREVAVVVLEL
jgi:hypothetical protein